jgi:hypothetical protein
MDLVCLAPHYVDHSVFFQQFPQMLKNESIQVLEVDIYGCMTRVCKVGGKKKKGF